MCGIVGYTGKLKAKSILLEGLKRLEYRGYDSAGLALYRSGDFVVKRAVGAVQNLVEASQEIGSDETQGIAHTRWATHGAPSEANAHPHRTGHVVLVHNGIIENHAELKTQLLEQGCEFRSETDTEVFSWLIETERKKAAQNFSEKAFDSLARAERVEVVERALSEALKKVEGHFAILFMISGLEGEIFGVQNGAPLALGQTEQGLFMASDLQPLLSYTQSICFLPESSVFRISAAGLQIKSAKDAREIKPHFENIEWTAEQVEKEGYEHFMLKEIFQQHIVVADTLSGRLPDQPEDPFVWDRPDQHERLWKDVKRVVLVACGTAYFAACTAKYFFEKWARLPVEVDLASEFRYRHPVFEPGTLVGVVSQSGETADTLSALRLAKSSGVKSFAVCNVPGSTIAREADYIYPTKAGPEIGVASTKAFTTQLTILCVLAQDVARKRGYYDHFGALARLPHDLDHVLRSADKYQELGASLKDKKTILFVGRGTMYPIALEGALKLKEITYRHAEGYAAGELKHGPIALVDSDLACIVLSPSDELLAKTLSNLEEIKSRGGYIIGVGEEGNNAFKALCHHYIAMPKCDFATAPMLYVVPLQLIAYGLAKALDCSIDKPRNLAKSVTVE